MKKKYDNDSKCIKDWTTQKLIKNAKALHGSIFIVECSGVSDLNLYENIEDELNARGYQFNETRILSITKGD